MSNASENRCGHTGTCRPCRGRGVGTFFAVVVVVLLGVRFGVAQSDPVDTTLAAPAEVDTVAAPAADKLADQQAIEAESQTADSEKTDSQTADSETAHAEARPAAAATAEPAAGSAAPHPLSVPPLDHAQYPDDRPEWIEATPDLDGPVAVWPVKSLLMPTAEEARESLQVQARGATAAYAEHVLGEEKASILADSQLEQIAIDRLPAEDIYIGTASTGEATVYEQAVRLRFDEAYRRRLAARWQEHEVSHRLKVVGVAGGVGLCLLLAGTGLTRRIARKHTSS